MNSYAQLIDWSALLNILRKGNFDQWNQTLSHRQQISIHKWELRKHGERWTKFFASNPLNQFERSKTTPPTYKTKSTLETGRHDQPQRVQALAVRALAAVFLRLR